MPIDPLSLEKCQTLFSRLSAQLERLTDFPWRAFRFLLIVLVILEIAANSVAIERAWSSASSSSVLPARLFWVSCSPLHPSNRR